MKIHNPNSLPTIDYREVQPLQGDLKDLTEKNYNKLKRVLEKRGFTTPLFLWLEQKNVDGQVVQNYWLMDGHQRQRVMTKEDMNDDGDYRVPYILIDAANEQEAKAQLLEISSQYGTITQEGFDAFTADLPEMEVYEMVNFDALPLLGTASDVEVEEDEAPEVDESQPAASKLGEIYQLGRHRLMCGDSTDFGMVSDLMDGVQSEMFFTDPPYNVNYQSSGGNGYSEGKYKSEKIFNDNKSEEEFNKFLEQVGDAYDGVLVDDAPIYVWHGDSSYNALPFYNMFKKTGWYRSTTIIWVKNSQTMTWQDYKPQHECCSYGWKGKKQKFNSTTETTIWRIDRDATNSYNHPTQKPVELGARAIRNHNVNTVVDAFGGSGSTLMACEQLEKTCYAMELDPKYCDVIRKRWYKYTHDDSEEGWEAGTPALNAVETAVDNQA